VLDCRCELDDEEDMAFVGDWTPKMDVLPASDAVGDRMMACVTTLCDEALEARYD
jgi:hypothetical protein